MNQSFGFYIDQQVFNTNLNNILFKLESNQDNYWLGEQERPLGTVKFFEQTKTMEAMFSWYPIKVDAMEIQCFQNNKSNYAIFPSQFFK